jgi:hypothetical protein
MADAPPEPDAPPGDPASAVLAAVANLSLRSARVPIDALAGDLPGLDPDAIRDALAELADAGWLTEWEAPGCVPGVCLSAMGGGRLGLRLAGGLEADPFGRWVARGGPAEGRAIKRRSGRSRTITEADLSREDETPLTQMPMERQGVRISLRSDGPGLDLAALSEADERAARLLAMRSAGVHAEDLVVTCGLAAEYARFRAWLDGAWAAEEVIVLTGGMPWPLPGQDRRDGPPPSECVPPVPEGSAPAPRPAVAGKIGPCPVCNGRKLGRNEFCASPGCERSGWDGRVGPAIRQAVQDSKKPKAVDVPRPEKVGKRARKKAGDGAGGRGKRFAGQAERGGLKGGLGA